MATPSDLVVHYSSKAFQTRIYALTVVGVVLASSIEHIKTPADANLIGTILILVVASLAELNRRYTHSYLCACKAATSLENNNISDNKEAEQWATFIQTNEKLWQTLLNRWLLSWSTYIPGLIVGIYLIVRGGLSHINYFGWCGIIISILLFFWWIRISKRQRQPQ